MTDSDPVVFCNSCQTSHKKSEPCPERDED